MARPPIPGPPPGAATGTRPGVGVTADGRHLSAKLGVVISELQKVNGKPVIKNFHKEENTN